MIAIKVFIQNIENGAEYDGFIYDFWISAFLNDGTPIKIFDDAPLDIRKYIGTHIDATLLASSIDSINTKENSNKEIFIGTVLEQKFLKDENFVFRNIESLNALNLFETSNGCFLINLDDLKSPREEIKSIKVIHFSLLDYSKC